MFITYIPVTTVQPTFYLLAIPWVNVIERLWKQLHATVTRNHTSSTMRHLMVAGGRFLDALQPFPEAGLGIASLESLVKLSGLTELFGALDALLADMASARASLDALGLKSPSLMLR